MGLVPLMFLLFIFFSLSNKLLSLLMLESCMLVLVSDYFYTFSSGISGIMICLILMVFLVLDSVFGLSLLGNSTRFSSYMCPFRFIF